MLEKDLNALDRLVDAALQLAVQMDQKTAGYLLSMARMEVSLQIKSAERSKPGGINQARQV